MTLNAPFIISSRLMAGLTIANGTISLGWSKRPGREGRSRYLYYIDIPAGEFSGDDMQTGCCGGSLQEGFSSLLAFLGAAAESYSYRTRTGRTGENEDLFPAPVVEWAYQHSDEIAMLQCEIEEQPELITD